MKACGATRDAQVHSFRGIILRAGALISERQNTENVLHMQRTQQDADDDVSAQLFCSKWGWRVLGLFLTHTDTAIYHSAPRPAAHVRATINKSTNPQHLTLCGPHVDSFYCKLNVNIIRERTCMLACGRLRMNANVREHIAKAQATSLPGHNNIIIP